MRLLLDECIGDRILRAMLVAAGHDVLRSIDALGGGADDSAVFAFARQDDRIVVTYNSADFKALGEMAPEHPGMLLVYQDNKPTDLAGSAVVKAIANVESAHPDGIANQMIALNSYRW